ncbi:hypothetical protein PC119_g5459 [Phytophthora cactorum]|uniref:Uncharacterized protein n=1 Tax=Phytophthora cactorum TaxID=29920 RepID=A0A8T1EAR6_9STRA|nr:hypothetical protein PC111_g1971 [Phytophthora cactorum]KAG3252823.1 hypothetical protein PI124_g2603 [Phytophthora idaei]KAG2863040.1 hypothetical protein PC113_g5750 [Phytophthora cactorum]KAG2920653.1 hypothetical protein PC114_g6015 [Phytophthora cactorum]KAG2948896.1 hypothetical protein PC117_g5692 [Phytophthora cactorum]
MSCPNSRQVEVLNLLRYDSPKNNNFNLRIHLGQNQKKKGLLHPSLSNSRLNFILASSNRKVCGQTHLVSSRLGQSSRGRAVLGVAAYKAQVIKQAFWSRHFTVESLGATNFN